MGRLIPILALLLVASLATPALGRSATDSYGDALDAMSGSRAVTAAVADVSAAADDKVAAAAKRRALLAHAERQINMAKTELRQMNAAYSTAMRGLKGDRHECERERLTAIVAAERVRLKSRIREFRSIRGDRRGFFSKAWDRIGPGARRVFRFIGDGALDVVVSGGSLGGGVARQLLLRAGRSELQGAALRAVARNVHGRSAVAVAAASSACGDDADMDEGDVPAIPPGTYVGEFPADTSADAYVTGKSVEANSVELRVGESGSISGEMAIRITGMFDGCPGYIQESLLVVTPGQRVGTHLPQDVSVDYDVLMAVPIGRVDIDADDGVDLVCGTDVEPFIDESGTAEVVIDADTEDVLVVAIGEDVVQLQWVP